MIFRKQPDAEPRYTLDDLRRDIGAAIGRRVTRTFTASKSSAHATLRATPSQCAARRPKQ